MALLGVSAVVGLVVFPLPVHLPGAPGDPSGGYLVIIPIFQHIQVESGGRFTW